MSGLKDFPTYRGLYPDGVNPDLEDAGVLLDEKNLELLTNLALVVFNKHYHSYDSDKEDMIQDALIKAIDLLRKGKFDPERSNIVNYLYTGMRNVQGHFVHKFRKRECLLSDSEGDSNVNDIMESLSYKNTVDDTREFTILSPDKIFVEWRESLPTYLLPYSDTKEGIVLFSQYYKKKLLMSDYMKYKEGLRK